MSTLIALIPRRQCHFCRATIVNVGFLEIVNVRRECLVAATDAGNGWVEVRVNARGEIVVSVYEPAMLTLWAAVLPEGVRKARRRCPTCQHFLDREGAGHLVGCPEETRLALPAGEGAS